MPSKPPSPHSTRLQNLNLEPPGAAFELDGHSVQLDARGYAAPVAAFQEFYHQALADYYRRSAELSRPAPPRVPIIGRMFSWIGRMLGHLIPGSPPSGSAIPMPVPAPMPPTPVQESPAARQSEITPPGGAVSFSPSPPPRIPDHTVRDPLIQRPNPLAPARFRRFSTWSSPTNTGSMSSGRSPRPRRQVILRARATLAPKGPLPGLELTYGLDSALAQRLQDCYGQLAQLGYKIAGLEAVRTEPEIPAAKMTPPSPAASAPSLPARPGLVETSPDPAPRATEPRARKPRVPASPAPPEPGPPVPEPTQRDPNFLPGI